MPPSTTTTGAVELWTFGEVYLIQDHPEDGWGRIIRNLQAQRTQVLIEAGGRTVMSDQLVTKTFRIQRFDPTKDSAPTLQDFKLECSPMERVLTALNRIKWDQDGSVAYRRSCGHAVCGSCGMTIQGASRLACKTLVKDIPGDIIEVAPLKGFPVVKDLVVDMEHFFHKYRAIKPYFISYSPKPVKERLQDPEEQEAHR